MVSSFGSWAAKPLAAVVLAAFLACGIAAQSLTAWAIYSIARDDVLPCSCFLRRIDGRRAGLAINAAAVIWLAFETVNIAWPRTSLAPLYQVWAAPIVLAVIAVVGLTYLAVARPHRRLARRAEA